VQAMASKRLPFRPLSRAQIILQNAFKNIAADENLQRKQHVHHHRSDVENRWTSTPKRHSAKVWASEL